MDVKKAFFSADIVCYEVIKKFVIILIRLFYYEKDFFHWKGVMSHEFWEN